MGIWAIGRFDAFAGGFSHLGDRREPAAFQERGG